jgi:carboxymethylenebutenolidase
MEHREVQIQTADGPCTTQIYHPDGAGPWPAVIVYMDAIGIRPAMQHVAERIGEAGYYVLLPDLFHRVEFDNRRGFGLFADPASREDLMTRVMPSASGPNVARDTEALLAFLDTQPEVRHGPVGVTGYCMGGRLALYVAGRFGERIGAAAAYHAGGVATDAPESPHRLAPNVRARVYVAGAIEDANFDAAQQARLEQALTDAGVEHEVTVYPARHGFVLRDSPVHDDAAEARHWDTLLALFDATLKHPAS